MSYKNLYRDKDEKRYVEFIRDKADCDREAFDRLAYAVRVLRILNPQAVTVALCPGSRELKVEEGAELASSSRGQRWALVFIPPDASRVHIAHTLAKIAGRAGDPYVLDVLLRSYHPY